MEAQSVALRGYIHGAVSSLQTRKLHVSTKLSNVFSSEIRCSFQSIHSSAKRNLRCRSSVEKVEYKGVYDTEEDKPKSKVGWKKLAVFVSGGGSNFRSIYEATLNGSIHGDIVALVTNKHDCGGAEYARDKGISVILFPPRKGAEEVFSADDLVTTLRFG